jgi:hypothetical protein
MVTVPVPLRQKVTVSTVPLPVPQHCFSLEKIHFFSSWTQNEETKNHNLKVVVTPEDGSMSSSSSSIRGASAPSSSSWRLLFRWILLSSGGPSSSSSLLAPPPPALVRRPFRQCWACGSGVYCYPIQNKWIRFWKDIQICLLMGV